jgi:hypothetical protein
MKKFFAILALVAALGIISACTQQPTSTGNPDATAPAPSAAPSAPAASCGGGGKG